MPRDIKSLRHAQQFTSDDHSVLEPPLPIPNRAVKRDRADDSVDYPCESRSSSDTHSKNPLSDCFGGFLLRAEYEKAEDANEYHDAGFSL